MKNVLSIKRIPMDIEINVTPWKYEMEAGAAPARAPVGRRPAQASLPTPTSMQTNTQPMPVINDLTGRDYFDFGGSAASARTYHPGSSSFGVSADTNSYMEDDLVSNMIRSPIRAQMAARPIESVSQRIGNITPPQSHVINWSNGRESLSFASDNAGDYTAVPSRSEWKFVPSSVEIVINQMPTLEIEYIGSPLYFPRSADPNYVPPPEI
jgi:hypothetical protein